MKTVRPVFLTNTMTGQQEQLKTLEPGKVRFYSCGPTVYNLIHIGNLRAALTADLLFRVLMHAGYEVTYVRNYTDIDDKIIQQAVKEGCTTSEVTKKYIQEVERDYALAGLLEPTHKTLVTEHIPEIISMIESLITRGLAYVAPDGEVLYAIEKFDGYGKLSHKKIDELQAGIRVEVSFKKRSPLDFTLWKPAKPGEPEWASPWGAGRPGWHIECSAMACKWLGEQMDLHHGGEDLAFPHHENEIAQSEGATGKAPYVGLWVHNRFLNLSGEKMSKSLGNVLTARDFLSKFSGEIARMVLFSAHYRSILDFSEDSVVQGVQGLQRIYEAKQRAVQLLSLKTTIPDPRAESLWGEFVAGVEDARRKINRSYEQDLGTPEALATLFGVVREWNRVCAEPRALVTSSAVLAAQSLIGLLEEECGAVMGIGRSLPESALRDLDRVRAVIADAKGEGRLAVEQVEKLINERIQARAAKNFAESDRIRKLLDEGGVVIKDSPQGTTWNYR